MFVNYWYVCTGTIGDYKSDKVYEIDNILQLDEHIDREMELCPTKYPTNMAIFVVRNFNKKQKIYYMSRGIFWKGPSRTIDSLLLLFILSWFSSASLDTLLILFCFSLYSLDSLLLLLILFWFSFASLFSPTIRDFWTFFF